MLVYQIIHMEDGALAEEILEEQVTNKWPGLTAEVNELCESLKIEDPKSIEIGRKAYNKLVKEACRWRDEAEMKEEMERMKDKKVRMMVNQNLDLKEYVKNGTLFSARRTWEKRSHLLDAGGNYPGHSK